MLLIDLALSDFAQRQASSLSGVIVLSDGKSARFSPTPRVDENP
jgi:hypothetical protein